jgi:pyridoxamine 5'-phosphate oxidase family protein
MSLFTAEEIAYLRGQRLGRLATASTHGELHVTPVGFAYNAELDTIDIGGGREGFGASRKYRDAQATGRAAFVVDDVLPAPGGGIRGIEIRGRAEAHATGGELVRPGGDPAFIRIAPTRIISWGINQPGYHPDARDVG